MRDQSLLLSALARPRNLAAYENPDAADLAAADLAAAYAIGIARNHAFLDGNKRTAWVVAEAFLVKNGYELAADDRHGLELMLAVADGSMPDSKLAAWFREWMRPVDG